MTAILKQCVICPQKSGRLTISSGKYDVTVVQYERMGRIHKGREPPCGAPDKDYLQLGVDYNRCSSAAASPDRVLLALWDSYRLKQPSEQRTGVQDQRGSLLDTYIQSKAPEISSM